MKALVIIPTYNEAENISSIISEVLRQDKNLQVLIVDDNSPDGTGKIVKALMKSNDRIHILEREEKKGLGPAYVAGFKYAIEQKYDYIFEMDADFSHDPAELPVMLEEIKQNDLVIGSRYIEGINVVNWPMRRLLLSFFAAHYVQFVTGLPVKDPTGGFKCFRREVLEKIDLDSILSDGYSFQVEMNFRTWKQGFKIKEIPIVFTDRRSGQSKMSKKIVREAIWMVWKLKLMSLQNKL
ncbi:MAG: polyprenol monophosphomannose synthase [Candidatus Cloacimonetes bacterium]|nr:polyprenol monophosphomannose synthase [Candidatus Cloacimonadota bacterium]MCF7813944.1 polyprenol monophosphomannose synthase [Candidatus Cloacimonadota bacterium]MCF7868038.1 polyprenol monophosphomannose synthase [Candidatus Cloacimonadota bacterium]MCF7883958.1 polyprenol monophosphomannose synthase [Candidatus Cloacimonadota bacterium]